MPASTNSSSHLNWLSRTIAILIFMVGPGLLGSWLDKQLTSQFFTPAGFALGILFATVLLIFYTQQFAPKAKGQPLPFEEEVSGEGSDDESLH